MIKVKIEQAFHWSTSHPTTGASAMINNKKHSVFEQTVSRSR